MSHTAGTGIERSVLDYVKNLGWGGLSSMKTGKERIAISSCAGSDASSCPSWATTSRNILAFTGAYRKVLIDYFITQYIARLDADAGAKAPYATFLNGRTLGQVVQYTAFGTDNPTSDYDVTLSGPRVHDIVGQLMESFRALTKHDKSMAFVFDSNFYIVPELLIPHSFGSVWRYGIRLFRPYACTRDHEHTACDPACATDDAACEVAVPVPDGPTVEVEWDEIIATKLGKHHAASDEEIVRKYAALVRLGAALDAFVYKGRESEFNDKAAFFKHLFAMKQTSVESYIGVSTVMAVVYGMQGGKMRCVSNFMTAQNFENACLENVLDFTNHWNVSVPTLTSFGDDSGSLALRVFVKLSKYLQRVFVCLEKALANESYDEALIPKALRKFVDETVASRSSLVLKDDVTSEQLEKFGCVPGKMIDLRSCSDDDRAAKGFVPAVYRMLCERRRARPVVAPRREKKVTSFGRLVV